MTGSGLTHDLWREPIQACSAASTIAPGMGPTSPRDGVDREASEEALVQVRELVANLVGAPSLEAGRHPEAAAAEALSNISQARQRLAVATRGPPGR